LDTLDYIDQYFSSGHSPGNKEAFEKRMTDDPAFAEEVAFYLTTKQIAGEQQENERRERFKELYRQYQQDNNLRIRRKTYLQKSWPWLAAAAVIAIIVFGSVFYFNTASPRQLADKFVQERFENLGVIMGGKQDSLQTGLRLYNEGKLEEALQQFEIMADRDSSSVGAKKYAGIVSLRLKEYDKALQYFSQLEKIPLYANPGTFYRALTLLERNQPGDKQQAKTALQQVVENRLEEEKTAAEWLSKW
jgi:tetratricopeptide (TPR) repeat protein